MGTKGIYGKFIKRFMDIILSGLALIVFSPLIMIIAILVRLKLGSPVIFRQARPGRNERIFYLYKFRSMTNEVGKDGRLLPDVDRLTKFGKFLRASSLDELPELVNIFKGDMSIVGPRPLSMFYLPHYPAEYRKRHSVRPGLTGLAQVSGRNNLPWDERFNKDTEYVDGLSFLLDLKIIMNTVLKVMKRSDISVRGTSKVKDYGPYCILKEENDGGKQMTGMTFSEIGSFFWLDGTENQTDKGNIEWLPDAEDSCFTFSGRNAIDLALRDILSTRRITKALVPSYCCISMLQAFIDRGIEIVFYDVEFNNGSFTYKMPETDKNSVVLCMNYFGFNTENVHELIRKLHKNETTVIEDITHSLLCEESMSLYSDYYVASIRKWFAVPAGGWIGKRAGKLKEKPYIDSDHAVSEKIAGMFEKYDYLTGKKSDKESFLIAQSKFDNDLIHVDRMLKIDSLSLNILRGIDIRKIKEKRRQNAEILIKGLKDIPKTQLTIPQLDLTNDTPLFVPVFIDKTKRDSLRKYLINKGIYCPVHWPEVMGASCGCRENELSLICDQRYSKGDMEAIVSAVLTWLSEQR